MGEPQLLARDAPATTWAHALRATLQGVSRVENFRRCGKPWRDRVEVVMAPTGETRRHGIHTCRSAWLCPVCWSTQRITARAELVWAGEQWYAAGGGLARWALTIPHDPGESLTAVWDRLAAESGALRSGQARADLRAFGVEHIHRAIEVTRGPGWHPHEHWLLFTRTRWAEPERAGLWRWIRERWRRRDTVNPDSPLYRPEYDPRLRPQDPSSVAPADLGTVAGHQTKGGSRTTEERYWQAREAGNDEWAQYLAPFAFGEQAAGGDPDALAAWVEYEQAVHRRDWLRWSNGARAVFGLDAKTPTFEGTAIYLSEARESRRVAG